MVIYMIYCKNGMIGNRKVKLKDRISIDEIFKDVRYEIPIYQRNYAWEQVQIEQLIRDIDESIKEDSDVNYFLGILVVNKKIVKLGNVNNTVYEVIDGQQRLTTLYLLKSFLGFKIDKEALTFEAREDSNTTLADINNNRTIKGEKCCETIVDGYNIIEKCFKMEKIDIEIFKKKLKKVFIIQMKVPKNIDLNHYFEIMNTRGEQLEAHEIVKAKMLSLLETSSDREVASLIWEKCSSMNSYIQMNFKKTQRDSIFNDTWEDLKARIDSFDKLKEILKTSQEEDDKKSIIEILERGRENNKELTKAKDEEKIDEDERFESILSFPNFLLQVNALFFNIKYKDEKSIHNENSYILDDKNLLKNMEWIKKDKELVKEFLFYLLKIRVLFDKYIVKREFIGSYKESGKWSLKRLYKDKDAKGNSSTLKYSQSLKIDNKESINEKLKTLESCLRVTYTAPQVMDWIYKTLTMIVEMGNNIEDEKILEFLENYCREKIRNSDYSNKNGFDIERIVFTYLDYLIYKAALEENKKIVEDSEMLKKIAKNWQFQFRNSVEHFYPQHPVDGNEKWSESDLNSLGNLALITVSGNSKFSNLLPMGKISSYKNIVEQSLKLKLMSELVLKNGGWSNKLATIHKEKMLELLNEDIEK